jgi:hypothetical protein
MSSPYVKLPYFHVPGLHISKEKFFAGQLRVCRFREGAGSFMRVLGMAKPLSDGQDDETALLNWGLPQLSEFRLKGVWN